MCQGRHSDPAQPENSCPPPTGGGLSSPTCLSLQGEGLKGEPIPLPNPYLNGLPKDSRLASFPSHSPQYPVPPPFCTAQGFMSACVGRTLPYSLISLFLDSHKPQRVHTISTQHRPGSKALICASYLPYPEILTWCSKLLSLLCVAQVPIFSYKTSS